MEEEGLELELGSEGSRNLDGEEEEVVVGGTPSKGVGGRGMGTCGGEGHGAGSNLYFTLEVELTSEVYV